MSENESTVDPQTSTSAKRETSISGVTSSQQHVRLNMQSSSSSGSVSVSSPSSTRYELDRTRSSVVRMRDVTSRIVADRLISFCNDHGDLISNLKLQRLLYYSQAWFLALYDEPLFQEPIYAIPNGTIEKTVWEEFAVFGRGPIRFQPENQQVPRKLDKHVAHVMEAYGHLSAFDLEQLIREEEPWKAAIRSGVANPIVPHSHMKHFYKLQINDGKQEKGSQ